MFGLLESLTKATLGLVIETPVAIVVDTLTMGGALTDKHQPYTATALEKVLKNIEDTTK